MSNLLVHQTQASPIRTHGAKHTSGKTARHFILLGMIIVIGNGLVLVLLFTLSGEARDAAFIEHFDDPTLPGWEHSPNVEVIGGVLRIPPGNAAFACCWGNLSLTVRARCLGNGFLSIGYRGGDMGGYGVDFGDAEVSLNRLFYGKEVELASTPITVPAGTWVTIQIIAVGNSHTVRLDGKTVLEIDDLNPFPPSMIALTNPGFDGATGEFDDLRVVGDNELEVAPNIRLSEAPEPPSDQ